MVSAVHTERNLRSGTIFFLPSAFDIGGICARVHAARAASACWFLQLSAAQPTLQHLGSWRWPRAEAVPQTHHLLPSLLFTFIPRPAAPLVASEGTVPRSPCHSVAGQHSDVVGVLLGL